VYIFVYCVSFDRVLFCVMCVVCVLCLVVVPLPPGENPFAFKINIYLSIYLSIYTGLWIQFDGVGVLNSFFKLICTDLSSD
jgi:flagellar biosynthesis component FlhA